MEKKDIHLENFKQALSSTIKSISENISKNLNCKIEVKKNLLDPRSYRLDSSKLLKIGFKPKKRISDAIEEIIQM